MVETTIVQLGTLLVLLFVLYTPFTRNTQLMILHALFVPMVMIRQVTDNNKCSLVMVEKRFRNLEHGKDTVAAKVLNTFYNKPVKEFTNIAFALLGSLFVVNLVKLRFMWNASRGDFRRFLFPHP